MDESRETVKKKTTKRETEGRTKKKRNIDRNEK